ncbi:hypothetical protein F5Y19DRAFT_440692 [Xylariaceae sp. FL1651]|nr:hypothetical protein F5Y19DRAFT_440692 [Xylariaceae sp. FL1651]
MPHKHTRKLRDESTFDLPPTQLARSLPVKQTLNKDSNHHKVKAKPKATPAQPTHGLKRKRDAGPRDDAPRTFKRLMAYAGGRKVRSGLDSSDGPRAVKGKKRNLAQETQNTEAETKPKSAIPTIRPGERMSEFSARVDAALPLAGLINKSIKGNKDPLGLKAWRTKKEMKMHKLYDEWREQDRKIKEKREEELELQAEKELDEEETGVSWKLNVGDHATGKRKKKAKADDEDPWEILRKKRGETRPGLHDVALAPPEFTVKPSKQLLVRGAAVQVDDIPKAAGSLKRREELQAARGDIVAAYRKAMNDKRPPLHVL